MPAFFGERNYQLFLFLRAKKYILRANLGAFAAGNTFFFIYHRRHLLSPLPLYIFPFSSYLPVYFLTNQFFVIKQSIGKGIIVTAEFAPALLSGQSSGKHNFPHIHQVGYFQTAGQLMLITGN